MMETYLRTVDAEWPSTIASLQPQLHPVDRQATPIWFSLYPLLMDELATRPAHYQLRGRYRLADQIHTSHRFLYGHRYWPAVRQAALQATPQPTLAETIASVARIAGSPVDLTLGIASVAVMTLRQAPDAMRTSDPPATKLSNQTPDDWLRRREGRTGWLARWTSRPSTPRVIFDEQQPDAFFALQPTQDLTNAAATDQRPYHLTDARCFENMGPIPVECRSGSCGTCWVGVLGGNENLSPVTPYERKRMEYHGYWDSGFAQAEADRPLIRLACQTQARGTASIVIPPWCAVFGAVRRQRHNGA